MKSTKGIIKTMKALRLLRRILFVGSILFILVFIGLHILVNIKGKDFLIEKLKNTFNREISIGSLNTSFPASVHIRDIEAKDLFKIKEVVAGGGLFDLFRMSFKLSVLKLIHPVVSMEKGLITSTAESPIPNNIPNTIDSSAKIDNPPIAPNTNPTVIKQLKLFLTRFYIRHLIIDDGTFNFMDRDVDKNGLLIKIEHLNIKVDNLNFTTLGSRITSFELKGKVPWREGSEEGKIETDGWINLFKKDMRATLKVNDIDGVYLYPYYSQWVDLEKARIEKAKLNFTSNISGLNNNLTAECHLELTDIVRRPRTPEEEPDKAEKIATAVLNIFRALNQGKIALDFIIKTKMDRPEFGFSDVRTAFEDKLTKGRKGNGFKAEDILIFPGKLLEGAAKGATGFSMAIIDGVASVGKELKNAVEDAFKKSNKE